MLRPIDAARSNGIALVDVVNRGRKTILTGFNRGGDRATPPGTPISATDSSCAGATRWSGSAGSSTCGGGPERWGIEVPAAQGVSAIVRAEFTPNERGPQTVADLAGYTPADSPRRDTDADGARWSVRPAGAGGARRMDAQGQHRHPDRRASRRGGLTSSSYRADNFPVAGLGLAAFRDVAAWIKRAPDALAHAPRTIAFGSSQSGRFLQTFLYYGFNADERGAQVLRRRDGAHRRRRRGSASTPAWRPRTRSRCGWRRRFLSRSTATSIR